MHQELVTKMQGWAKYLLWKLTKKGFKFMKVPSQFTNDFGGMEKIYAFLHLHNSMFKHLISMI